MESEQKQRNDSKVIAAAAVGAIPADQLRTLPYFQNRGAQFVQRALINDKQGRIERAFSDTLKWHVESKGGGEGSLFCIIDGCKTHEEVMLTVFQWLATNVGNAILQEAMKEADKVKS